MPTCEACEATFEWVHECAKTHEHLIINASEAAVAAALAGEWQKAQALAAIDTMATVSDIAAHLDDVDERVAGMLRSMVAALVDFATEQARNGDPSHLAHFVRGMAAGRAAQQATPEAVGTEPTSPLFTMSRAEWLAEMCVCGHPRGQHHAELTACCVVPEGGVTPCPCDGFVSGRALPPAVPVVVP